MGQMRFFLFLIFLKYASVFVSRKLINSITNHPPRETPKKNNPRNGDKTLNTHLDVVAFANEAPCDEGVDAQAVENPVRVVHLRPHCPDCGHRAEERVRACQHEHHIHIYKQINKDRDTETYRIKRGREGEGGRERARVGSVRNVSTTSSPFPPPTGYQQSWNSPHAQIVVLQLILILPLQRDDKHRTLLNYQRK